MPFFPLPSPWLALLDTCSLFALSFFPLQSSTPFLHGSEINGRLWKSWGSLGSDGFSRPSEPPPPVCAAIVDHGWRVVVQVQRNLGVGELTLCLRWLEEHKAGLLVRASAFHFSPPSLFSPSPSRFLSQGPHSPLSRFLLCVAPQSDVLPLVAPYAPPPTPHTP